MLSVFVEFEKTVNIFSFCIIFKIVGQTFNVPFDK